MMTEAEHLPVDIHAAGAVCWRIEDGELFVLLVHRPRYDDWSWPKGKLDAHETTPAAAIREVHEETGLTVHIGIPLPPMRYTLRDGLQKQVTMWAAHTPVTKLPKPPRPREVDAQEWVSAKAAAKQLTRREDRLQLSALTTAFDHGALETFPIVLLRPAHSYPTRSWKGSDKERPLVEVGKLQSRLLRNILPAWAPEALISSKTTRSLATLTPYSKRAKIPVKLKGKLNNKNTSKNPEKTVSFAKGLLLKHRAQVVCAHSAALHLIATTWAKHGTRDPELRNRLAETKFHPGSLLTAHISVNSGEIVAIECHLTPTSQN